LDIEAKHPRLLVNAYVPQIGVFDRQSSDQRAKLGSGAVV
jgi:hypothetical protein